MRGWETLRLFDLLSRSKDLSKRIEESLRNLGVVDILEGREEFMGFRILDKGFSSIVLLVLMSDGSRAVAKIKRPDVDRDVVGREAEMLRIANSVGVGPRLLGLDPSNGVLLLEFIDGEPIASYVSRVEDPRSLRKVIVRSLEKGARLDGVGLDHGQLSRADRHILVGEKRVEIIDFERASTKRKPKNVTALLGYFFLNPTSSVSRRIVGSLGLSEADLSSIRNLARKYREGERTALSEILDLIKEA